MFKMIETNSGKIAQVQSREATIHDTQDVLDVMGNANYQGANSIILHQDNLHPDFFDLKTGVAGELLQKFSNYHMKLAIIGSFDHYQSTALRDFIRESNRGGLIFFVPDQEAARAALSGK